MDKCDFCQEEYETGRHPYYKEGNITFCAECYERLLKENFPPKVVNKRIKDMACKPKKKKK